MNFQIGNRLFQLVWWGLRFNIGYWRWPPLNVREDIERVTPGRGMKFGFHGLYVGPIEFRYHPVHGKAMNNVSIFSNRNVNVNSGDFYVGFGRGLLVGIFVGATVIVIIVNALGVLPH